MSNNDDLFNFETTDDDSFDMGGFDDDNLFDDNLDTSGFDEELPQIEEEEGRRNRTFVILGVLFMIVFVVLSAIIAVILLGSGEECGENCQLATQITSDNLTTEALQIASVTQQSIIETETAIAVETQSFIATETVIAASTATREFQDAEATRQVESQNQDATATRVAEIDAATQTATALTPPPTDTPMAAPTEAEDEEELGTGGGAAEQDVQGQLTDRAGRPIAGVTLCIFADNGDGVFEPTSDAPGDCDPARFLAVADDDDGADTDG
ncbi:MAG: hypothetical protein ACLFTK_15305, partial [Anaerolineales bacterium]